MVVPLALLLGGCTAGGETANPPGVPSSSATPEAAVSPSPSPTALEFPDEAQGEGTVDHVPIYPREVVKRALELNASALILVHNHPSGDPTPSEADIAMTGQIDMAANALGLTLHDHLVIGRDRALSFRSEGLL